MKTNEVTDFLINLIKFIITVWDLVTWPLYQIVYRPWEQRKLISRTRSRPIRTSDAEIVYEAPEKQSVIHDDIIRAHCDTMDKAWLWAVKKYTSRPIFGTRDILAHEDEAQPNGKVFKKFHLGDYRWINYEEADTTAEYFGRGLRGLGLEQRKNVCIYADTRAEWMLSAQGCFKQTFPLATIYTNLGVEAVVHGLNQTEAEVVITSHELLPKFKAILPQAPSVKTIVYFEDQVKTTETSGFKDGVDIISFWDVISLGKKTEVTTSPATPKDTAIIMYTSGSTGVPKGVVLSHRNLFATLKSILLSLDLESLTSDTYLAYLPLAHVLELLCETMMCMYGVKIGYSTPNTMTDKSSMVKKGSMGDASILQPTVMAAVPLILDRIYKAITDTVERKGPFFRKFFQFCFDYRLRAIHNGEDTPIMNALIFSKIRALLGGRMRVLMTGGAPLSQETHNYMRVCIGCPLLQGYGLTETTACATLMEMDDISTGKVGPPNQGVQIKLMNWDEGNYRVTDSPLPRGEIVVGGNCIAEGYYLLPDKTAEEFYEDHSRRWFRTGDIGQFELDGTIRIIDRKKDLVKLQFGEYVSLGKVEACLKTCPVVENVCIYGESSKSYCVALVSPDRKALAKLAEKFQKQDLSFEEMCADKDLTGSALRELVNHGKAHKLEKFEIPGAVTLVTEAWTPDSGLVTAAFKLKRKPIQEFYQRDLDRMYGIK